MLLNRLCDTQMPLPGRAAKRFKVRSSRNNELAAESLNSSRTRGSVGRLNESEALWLRLVKVNWQKRLICQNQNGKRVGLCAPSTHSGIHHSRRVKDAS